MTGLVQLYQRLFARATQFRAEELGGGRTHTVRTEVTVEQEQRLWLIRDIAHRHDSVCPVCGHALAGVWDTTPCTHLEGGADLGKEDRP